MDCVLERGGPCGDSGGISLGIRNTSSSPKTAYWIATLHRGLQETERPGETRILPKALAIIQCSKIGLDNYTLRVTGESEG